MDRAGAIRDLANGDLDWVFELNLVHEALLSPLDREGIASLAGGALFARVIAPRAAFLIAFDQDADHDSLNFQWFRARYPRFIYVDRIAVDAAHAGAGHGGRLYDEVFDRARAMCYPVVCAEVNSDPPNQASLAFHDRQGFAAVDEQWLPGGDKAVRYFVREVAPGVTKKQRSTRCKRSRPRASTTSR